MKERPILFSGAMVRAILTGKKTQTRRAVKGASGAFWDHPGWEPVAKDDIIEWSSPGHSFSMPKRCPYGQVGDRLWVKETWSTEELDRNGERIGVQYQATPTEKCRSGRSVARPDGFKLKRPVHGGIGNEDGCWRSPLFMPRWASRLTLEVTDVRVERLQDISEADARAEGCSGSDPEPVEEGGTVYCWKGRSAAPCPLAHYRHVWESINGKKHPWSSNPWVWAITFKRVEP